MSSPSHPCREMPLKASSGQLKLRVKQDRLQVDWHKLDEPPEQPGVAATDPAEIPGLPGSNDGSAAFP